MIGREKTAHQTATDRKERRTAAATSARPKKDGLNVIATFRGKQHSPRRRDIPGRRHAHQQGIVKYIGAGKADEADDVKERGNGAGSLVNGIGSRAYHDAEDGGKKQELLFCPGLIGYGAENGVRKITARAADGIGKSRREVLMETSPLLQPVLFEEEREEARP